MSKIQRTQVGIIGAGPAGLVLSKWLHLHGIDNIVLESQSRHYVENRLRAGLLEHNTVQLLREMGVADNLNAKGITHHGVKLSFNRERVYVPFEELTGGRSITIYGQRFVVRDMISNLVDEENRPIYFEAEATKVDGIDSQKPAIYYNTGRDQRKIICDFVVACDGYHGVGRKILPVGSANTHRLEYPFSWLGILAETPPSSDELIYAYHQNGFALLSYRSPQVSRLYLQVDNDDQLDHWSDDRIWSELHTRLGSHNFKLNEGKITQKGITPMRTYMIDHLQSGRLFLAGDAAHIVPPTGGKGLNLAVADVKILGQAFEAFYKKKDDAKLASYSQDSLRRVWRVQEFSNFMTTQFHKISAHGSFEYHLQKSRFDYICSSKAMLTTIAENYVGLDKI